MEVYAVYNGIDPQPVALLTDLFEAHYLVGHRYPRGRVFKVQVKPSTFSDEKLSMSNAEVYHLEHH